MSNTPKLSLIIREQIIESERRLLSAIKDCDVDILNELLHDDLLFNMPNGQTITKEVDLDNYRSGYVVIDSISADDQMINLIESVAVVSVTIEMRGSYFGQVIEGKFRYIRVWKLFNEQWKVVAGSCVAL